MNKYTIILTLATIILNINSILAQISSNEENLNDSIFFSLNKNWPVKHTTSIGFGQANLYDTYLSPLKYSGISFLLQYERNSRKRLFGKPSFKQIVFNINFANTENTAKNNHIQALLTEFRLGYYRPIELTTHLENRIGLVGDITTGIIYNHRNSNNPASAKLSGNISLSGQILKQIRKCLVRYQIDIPIIGCFFSPAYRQSYYEIWLGNRSQIMHLATIHNQRSLLSKLSVDIPVKKTTIRLSLQNTFHQTYQNSLNYHLYNHCFMIGITNTTINLKHRKTLF